MLSIVNDLMVNAILLFLTLLDRLSSAAISDVGHHDEQDEAHKGQVGFPLAHLAIEKHHVKPDVRNDRPDCRDSEDARVLNFLDAFRCSAVGEFLLGALVIILMNRVNRDSRDHEEVESGRADDG